ncbi:MAG: hypothetical protein A3I61_01075 [Acidobacteria bacterium RIFCSPLOWO2_02_FULL_68_18]|nr:MAG: hypothetical protein A3I61_01075 [Acidobacteria bacterium RIFCSPLOWO2_02_FULL_68_18]OFW51514.1 MAG: hypothetical protein A3G77_18485 [Acidobacteria bacterium RIFCSPLOWO2_12_FULL_68_19]
MRAYMGLFSLEKREIEALAAIGRMRLLDKKRTLTAFAVPRALRKMRTKCLLARKDCNINYLQK